MRGVVIAAVLAMGLRATPDPLPRVPPPDVPPPGCIERCACADERVLVCMEEKIVIDRPTCADFCGCIDGQVVCLVPPG